MTPDEVADRARASGGPTPWSFQMYKVLVATQDLEEALLTMDTGVRGFLLTKQPRFPAPYRAGHAVFPHHLQKVRRLTADHPVHVVSSY